MNPAMIVLPSPSWLKYLLGKEKKLRF